MSSQKNVNPKRKIDAEVMAAAIKEVRIDKKPVRTAAREHGIPRSTLLENIKKMDAQIPDMAAIPDTNILDVLHYNRDRHLTVC